VDEAVVARFQEPVDEGTFRQFVADTARGMAKKMFTKELLERLEAINSERHRAAMASEDSPYAYTPAEVAAVYKVTTSFVYHWLKKRAHTANQAPMAVLADRTRGI
jgi:uridine phosphorylase